MAIHLPRRTPAGEPVDAAETRQEPASSAVPAVPATPTPSTPATGTDVEMARASGEVVIAAEPEPHRWSHLLEASEDTGIGRDLPPRGWAFDVVLAVAFAGIGATFLPVFSLEWTPDDFIYVVAIAIPVVIRRRFPIVSFLLILGVALVQMLIGSPIGVHDVGLLFALYSLVGYTNRRIGLAGFVAVMVAALIGSASDWWGFLDDQLTRNRPNELIHVFTTALLVVLAVGAWASGERLRSARIGLAALADRAATLEREREQQAALAAAAERARIAREMHDVIAHALSVMIAQADGARYVIDASPVSAKDALDRISHTGRDSLTQMRGLLGLLRGGDADQGFAPQPGLDQLSELITEAGNSGLRVDLHHQGERHVTAQMVGLTTYRVVQEGLSNARKHGGDDVRIDLEYHRDGLRLQVENSRAPADKQVQTGPPGHGLTGMAERVAAVGGLLETGPTDRGFKITVWMPYYGKGRG